METFYMPLDHFFGFLFGSVVAIVTRFLRSLRFNDFTAIPLDLFDGFGALTTL